MMNPTGIKMKVLMVGTNIISEALKLKLKLKTEIETVS